YGLGLTPRLLELGARGRSCCGEEAVRSLGRGPRSGPRRDPRDPADDRHVRSDDLRGQPRPSHQVHLQVLRRLLMKQCIASFAKGLLIAIVVGATAGLVLGVLQHVVAAVWAYWLVIGLLVALVVVEKRRERL